MLSSVCMIIIAEKYTNSVKKNGFTKYLGELSTYVYITHWGIMEIVRQITPTIVGIANISEWINPILTLLGSFDIIVFYNKNQKTFIYKELKCGTNYS